MFSGSITILVFLAFFSSGASGQNSTTPAPAPPNTMTSVVPSASQQTGMASSTAEPTSPPASVTTKPEMKPSCAKIAFTAKMAWNASFGDSQSMLYKESVKMISTVLRSVFNNTEKYDDVKVTEVKFADKGGQLQVKAKLCLFVKANDVYIEDVFKTKVKSGKLNEMIEVMPDSAEFEVEGVTFKDWKAKECKICNDGGAGEFVIEGTCTPTENCKGLKNTKMSKDCEEYCSSAASITVSFLILALGILLSFSFQ